jgi:tetratricopeptide (TPR) repeat protein
MSAVRIQTNSGGSQRRAERNVPGALQVVERSRSLDAERVSDIISRSHMPHKRSSPKKLTRQEQRNLDIEIGFIEGVVKRDPGYVEALQILGDNYTRRGRYVDGLKVDEQLSRLRPRDALVQYNLACSYSLTDQLEPAFAALNRALDLGYRDFKWMAKDPDLKNVRRHALYKKIRARIKAMTIQVD